MLAGNADPNTCGVRFSHESDCSREVPIPPNTGGTRGADVTSKRDDATYRRILYGEIALSVLATIPLEMGVDLETAIILEVSGEVLSCIPAHFIQLANTGAASNKMEVDIPHVRVSVQPSMRCLLQVLWRFMSLRHEHQG